MSLQAIVKVSRSATRSIASNFAPQLFAVVFQDFMFTSTVIVENVRYLKQRWRKQLLIS